jgi:hypothetical protein
MFSLLHPPFKGDVRRQKRLGRQSKTPEFDQVPFHVDVVSDQPQPVLRRE